MDVKFTVAHNSTKFQGHTYYACRILLEFFLRRSIRASAASVYTNFSYPNGLSLNSNLTQTLVTFYTFDTCTADRPLTLF